MSTTSAASARGCRGTATNRIAARSPAQRGGEGRGFDGFKFSGEEIGANWTNRDDVEVLAFHIWTASRMRIADVSAANRIARFTGTTRGTSDWAAFRKGNRYFVENVREALGEPGQWYLDRPQGELIYIPREGERPEIRRCYRPASAAAACTRRRRGCAALASPRRLSRPDIRPRQLDARRRKVRASLRRK